MGRRRIVIEEIKDSNKRYVTFTKRRQGLFKKADTACRMYGSQIGIIVFSPTGKLYTSGPVDSVIDQFLHQSSYLNELEEENVVVIGGTSTTTTTTTGDHIENGKKKKKKKKRSRSGGDDDDRVPMMMLEERETKKRKLLVMSSSTTTTTEAAAAAAAAATTQEEEENEELFLLIKNSETEQEAGLMMMNEFMGFEQNVTELEEKLLGESQSSREEETDVVDYNMGSSSLSTVVTTTSQLAATESDHDELDLDEVLHGFADYIITSTDHPYEETTMFDLLPHQGVYDDDEGCFTFCDNWPGLLQ